jgi:hypothetical protein
VHAESGEAAGDEEGRGIIPRAAEFIFKAIATHNQDIKCELTVSMVEIYNDRLRGALSLQICSI